MKEKVLPFLQREIDLQHIPGAVIHISYQKETILQEAIGHRVVFPKKEPMKLETIFDLASLTKVVATLPAILLLMEAGKLHLDDKVSYFFPEFARHDKSHITIKHLLTHSSGLKAHQEYFKESLHTEQIIERIFDEKLVASTGEKVMYSDLGFILLYKIIEKVIEEDFQTFLKRELFEKLHMSETSFQPNYERERFAATEFSEALQDHKHGIVHDDNTESMGGVSGHAGLFSTISDLANFASMIENNGLFQGSRILTERSIAISRENFTPFSSEHRGLGWMLKSPAFSGCGDLFSTFSYGHTGFTGTSIWFDPDIQLHVILLTNRVHFGRKDPILRLRPRLHNLIHAQISRRSFDV
ncbi:serine hydrolase domain-containing protein [Bacillus timonensis]|uniref:serine hydrolase domain-containing protein n=1 Tax=Bacillus timonensis TaxID=1033734 RepID=UPI000287D877|nr:serine hydrolase domain-containing protein [Bacillus timonensis]